MRVFLVLVVFVSLFLSGCVGLPEGVYPVDDFDLNKYLGKWYEIARLDHSFERGLDSLGFHFVNTQNRANLRRTGIRATE